MQSWKTEKNLKFLLQKVLKQSDVGNLGRIVLPKVCSLFLQFVFSTWMLFGFCSCIKGFNFNVI